MSESASVYKINNKWIVAKNQDDAFSYWENDEMGLEDFIIDDLEEGQSNEFTITIRRLTQEEIEIETLNCCVPGAYECDRCEGKDGPVKLTFKEVMDSREMPYLLAIEY